MDWETIVSTFASGLVGEWVALAIVSMSLELWRRRRSRRMRVQRRARRLSEESRGQISLTKDQILMVQACIQALAIQAEAEMRLEKAEALHELDRELVQAVGRMSCQSVVGMMDTTDILSDDRRL